MKLITNYKGIGILSSKGYFYPSVDTETLCYTIEECVDWIEDYYLKNQNRIIDPYILIQASIEDRRN